MADQPVLSPAMQQQIQELLGLSTQRASESAPVHQAAMAMAQHLAPTYARSAITGPPAVPTGSIVGNTSGGSSSALAAIAAALGGAGNGAGGDLGKILAALKKLFGAGGPGIQGNKPYAGGINNPGGNNPLNDAFTGFMSGNPFANNDFSSPSPTPNVDTSYSFPGNSSTDDAGGYYDTNGNYQAGQGGGGFADWENP